MWWIFTNLVTAHLHRRDCEHQLRFDKGLTMAMTLAYRFLVYRVGLHFFRETLSSAYKSAKSAHSPREIWAPPNTRFLGSAESTTQTASRSVPLPT